MNTVDEKTTEFSKRMHASLKGIKPLLEKRKSIHDRIVNHRNRAITWRDSAEAAEDQIVSLKGDLIAALGNGGDPTETNKKIVTLTQQVENYRDWATQIEDEFLPPLIASLEEINGNIKNAAHAQICNLREAVTVEVDSKLSEIEHDLGAWTDALWKIRTDFEIKGEIGSKICLKKRKHYIIRDAMI